MAHLLSRLIKILTLRCDEASLLMSDSFDRKLRIDERLALRGHLFACSVCPKLHAQLRFVVQASRRRGKGDAGQQVADEVIQIRDARRDLRLNDETKHHIKQLLRSSKD